MIPLGIGFIIFTYLVINGASNAVNLTDGLDGLAIMPVVLVAAGLGVLHIWLVMSVFANSLHIPYVRFASELVVICPAMIGAGLAFLWFNAHPAQVFMGDVGALSLVRCSVQLRSWFVRKLSLPLWLVCFWSKRFQSSCKFVPQNAQ